MLKDPSIIIPHSDFVTLSVIKAYKIPNAGAFGGTAGLTWNSTNQTLTLATIANPAAAALTITGGGLTGTTSYPALNITQTWNNASGTFTGITENVTNTNSASGSLLMDLQVGGTSEHNVDKLGNGYFANSIGIGATPVSGINLYSAGSTAVFGTGEAGASPSGGTIRAPNGSGTNITGGNLTIRLVTERVQAVPVRSVFRQRPGARLPLMSLSMPARRRLPPVAHQKRFRSQ